MNSREVSRILPVAAAIVVAASLLASADPVEVTIAGVMFFILVVWIGSYQMGLYSNLKYSKMRWFRKLFYHTQALVLAPLIGLVETFPAFWATLEYAVKRRKRGEKMPVYDFYIIKK